MAARIKARRGVTGLAVWDLPDSIFSLLWMGPRSGLLLVSDRPGGIMTTIQHPTADGSYDSFRQANAAARAFIAAAEGDA